MSTVSNDRLIELKRRTAQLWAVHEIQQLAHRYAVAFDTRDLPMLHDLWDRDAPATPYPDITWHTVRDEFGQWLYGLGVSVLTVGNHVIELDDEDHAHGVVYCQVQIEQGDAFIDQSILYQDEYVRIDGRWLFHKRRHLLWYGVERDRHPLRQPDANWPENVVGRGTLPEELPAFQAFRAGSDAVGPDGR